ncbi:MAG: glycoside hydrolase family 5 protein [Treponema sp.]|nr:glycoside hydrolase family 5 protein [Treponema sp.]
MKNLSNPLLKSLVFIPLFFMASLVLLASCKSKIEYQENGLAVLNIKKPLLLEAYKTSFCGDGTFHDAEYIAKDMKIGLNLGNTMEAYEAKNCEKITYSWIPVLGKNTPADYERCWGSPIITQEMVDGIKAAGFNTVRIPVFWGNMMENDGKWIINPDYLDRVRQIVDYCLKDDLYAVVNIHHFDEFIIRRNNLEDCKTIIANIWSQIASYFNNYSEKLIFEGFNEYLGGKQFTKTGYLAEMRSDKAYELTNALNDTFVKAVRSTGGNNEKRVLIISGYWTNIDLTTGKSFIIPEDYAENKLMVSVHYVDNSMYWSRSIGGERWIKYIDNQCAKLDKAFTAKGIPVFLGETTSGYPAENITGDLYTTSPECLEYVLTKLLEHGFVPVLWDTHNDSSFYWRDKACIRDEKNQAVINKLLSVY